MSKEQVPSKQRLVLQPKPIDIHHAGQMGLISSNAIPAVSSSLIHGEHVKKRTKGNTLNRRKHIDKICVYRIHMYVYEYKYECNTYTVCKFLQSYIT